MRRLAPLLLVLLVVLPAVPVGAADSAHNARNHVYRHGGNENRRLERSRRHRRASCGSHTDVVYADGRAEIYLVYVKSRDEEGWTYRGCVFGSRRSYFVPGAPFQREEITSTEVKGTTHLTLAGAFVAYEKYFAAPGAEPVVVEDLVYVYDLRTGRVVHRVPTGTPAHPTPLHVGIGGTTAIVLKPDGSVAWIVATGNEEGGYQVHAVDKSGSRELAAGHRLVFVACLVVLACCSSSPA